MADLSTSRRSFLGGLLTLAVAPPAPVRPSGLTPLERTVEAIRRARLDFLHQRGTVLSLLQAIQPLHAMRLTSAQRHRLLRLAFLMARRDYQLGAA